MAITNRDEPQDTPGRRAKRTRGEPKLYICFLPEGRGGPREDKGSVPLEVDVEGHIEERTDCEPGLYRIEKKRSGEFSGEVLFYQKEEPLEEPAARGDFAEVDVGGNEADLHKLVASAVSATLEARDRRATDPMEQFRQMRELLKEERAEMQRQLSEQGGESSDPLKMFERFVELHKKLQPEVAQNPESEVSVKDRAQLMLMKESGLIPQFMRSMKEMLHAPEDAVEPKGMVEQVLDFLNGWTPYLGPVLAPTVGHKLSEVVNRVNVDAIANRINTHPGVAAGAVDSTATLPQSSETPAAQASAEMMTVEADLQGTISVIVDCMTLDTDDSDGQEHLSCAVEAVRGFMERNPMAQPILASMFARASSSLVLEISQLRPEWAYVAKLGNASRFISDLKDSLDDDDETESNATGLLKDAASSAARSNGADHGVKVES